MFNNLKNDFPFEGGGVNDQAPYNEVNVDGRPLWFDPIFLEVFEELKLRYLYLYKNFIPIYVKDFPYVVF